MNREGNEQPYCYLNFSDSEHIKKILMEDETRGK